MFPYIIMFAHFLISLVVIFFAYKSLIALEKIKVSNQQSIIASLALTVPAYAITFFKVPAIVGVVAGAILLFLLQKSYIKDSKINGALALKLGLILILVIILILMASSVILK